MRLIKIALALGVLFLIAAVVITVFLGPDSLRFCQAPSTGDCRKADAIVVVSGGDTAARTAEAIKLHKAGYAPHIIFSGAAADTSGPSNAFVMRAQAVAAGVPGEATTIEEKSTSTDQNAAYTVKLAKEAGYQSLIVVTSAYHQRRAQLLFQHYGVGMDIRSHPVAEDKDWNRFWWLTPRGWSLAISELSKSAVTSTGGIDR